MRLTVSVRPNAKTERVEQLSDHEFRVWVKAPARQGKANKAMIDLLSRYLSRPKSAFVLHRGATSRKKTLEIL